MNILKNGDAPRIGQVVWINGLADGCRYKGIVESVVADEGRGGWLVTGRPLDEGRARFRNVAHIDFADGYQSGDEPAWTTDEGSHVVAEGQGAEATHAFVPPEPLPPARLRVRATWKARGEGEVSAHGEGDFLALALTDAYRSASRQHRLGRLVGWERCPLRRRIRVYFEASVLVEAGDREEACHLAAEAISGDLEWGEWRGVYDEDGDGSEL